MIVFIQKDLFAKEYISYLEEITKSTFYIDINYKNTLFEKYSSNIDANYILIRGENLPVKLLVSNLFVSQKNIILITCTVKDVLSNVKSLHYKSKNIYVPKYSENGNYLTKYNGKAYEFDFDPCLAELKMYLDKEKYRFRENLLHHFDRKHYDDL